MGAGMAKTGLFGVGTFVVPILATILGSKSSTGFLLPILIIADVFGVLYYKKYAKWDYLIKLFPATALGVFFGIYVGDLIDPVGFKYLLVSLIVIGLGLMLLKEWKSDFVIPNYTWLAWVVGFFGGFVTMIANAAGPIMAIYLISMGLPKNVFIGTAAWFFLIVNTFKVPFHVIFWETIDLNSFVVNLSLAPAIVLGAFIGVKVVRLLPEKPFRIFAYISIALATLKMLV